MQHISVTVPQDDAVALQAAAYMFDTIARARVGLAPVGATCGCKEQPVGLGPITAHCLELAKAANAEDAQQVDSAGVFRVDVELAREQGTIWDGPEAPNFAQPPAPPLPPMDDPRVVPELSGTYTSPTGQLAPTATLDKNGLPWDERINTSNKAQTQQGVWKRKPGLTDEQYNSVIAELRTAQGASVTVPTPPAAVVAPPAPVAAPSAPPAPVAVEPFPGDDMTPGVPPAPVAAPPVEPVALFNTLTLTSTPVEPPPNVPAPPAPAAAPPAPAADEQIPQTIAQLIPLVTQAISSGKITLEAVNAIIKDVTGGAIASMPILATRADLIPSVYQHLKNAWSLA